MSAAAERRPKGPGLMFGALSVVMLAIVTIVALVSRQPPPPTIAEFAPQAAEQITDAPSEQSSEFGSGDGDCPPGAVCEEGSGPGGGGASPPPRQVIDVARVRACVGDPPRQIEDPQSPPCVPYFDGDNGGATYKGVTRDEVRVVIPMDPGQWSEANENMFIPSLERFFNNRFEFYGRKLKLIVHRMSAFPYDNPGAQDSQDAAAVLNEYGGVFASAEYRDGDNYYRELARARVLSVNNRSGFMASDLASQRPYRWQYSMGTDQMLATTGEWVCKRLAKRPARFAPDLTLRQSTREFGLVVQVMDGQQGIPFDFSHFTRELGRCEVSPKRTSQMVVQNAASGDSPANTAAASDVMLKMKEDGVTSIVCLCHFTGVPALTNAGSSQNYMPEWIMTSYGLMDREWTLKFLNGNTDQRAAFFGISVIPRQLRAANEPARWASRAGNPNYEMGVDGFALANLLPEYRDILFLASGIQMAGPNLTPETFERGLHRTRFPNPRHPNMAGDVGFTDRDHAMTDDATEWWWSETANSPYGGRGTLCYLNGGARSRKGGWVEGPDDGFFTGTCDSGA